MKLTESKLRSIIREELNYLSEAKEPHSGRQEEKVLERAVQEALDYLYTRSEWKASNTKFGVAIHSPHKPDEVAYVKLEGDKVVLEDFYQGKIARIDVSGGVERNYDHLVDELVYAIEDIQTEEEYLDPMDRNPPGV